MSLYWGTTEISGVNVLIGGSANLTTKSITANGTYNASTDSADGYSQVTVNVSSPTQQTQTKTATPTESQQTIEPDSGYLLSSVTVGAISSTYVGSGIDQNDSTDLTASGATVTAPAGYYATAASKAVASGSATTPATTITANPSITVGSDGLITATTSATQSVTPTVSAGYVSSGTAGTITVSGSKTSQLSTQAAATITPTESSQTAVAAGKYTTGAVTVGAISSTYVGSGIDQNDSDDLTASGATVSVPAGYYATAASKSVASGTEGTPTATKGTVSNHAISVTPSVTNTAGYISGGTKTGAAVSVSASELVSGTLSVSSSGTKDVTNYASASVPAMTLPTSAAASATSGYTSKATISRSTSDQYINIPTGFNDAGGYYKVNAVANGTEGTPTATKGTVSNHSVSVTPSVTNTAGYISGGTKTGTAVTVTASELASGNKAITSNGTGIDVIGYSTVSVAVEGDIAITDVANSTGTTAAITGEAASPSATAHEIYFEFSDNTNTTITGYWDSSFISDAITATVPTTYNNKVVTLAELDDVAWYEPANIQIGVQLVDYTKVTSGYIVSNNDGTEIESEWSCCSDFMPIDPTMTFSYIGYEWYYIVFYDSSRTFINASIRIHDDETSVNNNYGSGTLDSTKIPSNAAYVRISSYPASVDNTKLSLIRTA